VPIEWGFRFGTLEGACRVPVGARAVLVNITVTQATAQGYLSVFSSERRDSMLPTTSTLNFTPGQTIANAAIIPLCSPGQACIQGDFGIYTMTPGGSVHVIIDVVGYLASPQTTR
jgi:hypothetical protein